MDSDCFAGFIVQSEMEQNLSQFDFQHGLWAVAQFRGKTKTNLFEIWGNEIQKLQGEEQLPTNDTPSMPCHDLNEAGFASRTATLQTCAFRQVDRRSDTIPSLHVLLPSQSQLSSRYPNSISTQNNLVLRYTNSTRPTLRLW